jgi:asparagine synthase (glutamine-hydrolysing)
MCGIAGIVGAGDLREDITRMVAAQAHRGPDDHGIWIDERAGVALGHNRLSIIDLSAAGHQPMTDGNGLWLIFNGEIYNYRELRTQLTGYSFRSQSDSEVILAAWRRWGPDCVTRFIGMFALAVWDEKTRELVCVRDRLGIKPFLYAWHANRFLFSSEAKAILAAGVPAVADLQTWATYLVHGTYDHSERTFFAGLQTLPPAHYGRLKNGQWSVHRYWDPLPAADSPLALSDDEASAALTSLFEDSVRLRLRADVPIGVNLSGGLDSSMLVAAADKWLGDAEGELETFTASFGDPAYDEDSFAERVPRRSRWRRHVVRMDPEECWEQLPVGLWHQEAPFGGVATVAYHKLHAHARSRGIIVLLEAQGADEIFAGYPYFLPAYWRDLLEAGQGALLRREWRAMAPKQRDRWIAHTRSLMRDGGLSVHYDGTAHLPSSGLDPSLVRLAGPYPEFEAPIAGHLAKALWRDTRYSKLPRVLRMNDRLSMASGTELREPFLDHRIVEFAFRLPSQQKIRLGQGKFVERHALRGVLPPAACREPKRMVVTPQREWLRGPLRARTEEVLASRSFAERGLFDPASALRSFRRFAEGEGDNSFFAWQWINAELWFRACVDGATRVRPRSLAEAYPQSAERSASKAATMR